MIAIGAGLFPGSGMAIRDAGSAVLLMAGFLVRYEYCSCLVFRLGTDVFTIAVHMRYLYPRAPGWVRIAAFAGQPST
jgi:L-asparagine transporter-like permease